VRKFKYQRGPLKVKKRSVSQAVFFYRHPVIHIDVTPYSLVQGIVAANEPNSLAFIKFAINLMTQEVLVSETVWLLWKHEEAAK